MKKLEFVRSLFALFVAGCLFFTACKQPVTPSEPEVPQNENPKTEVPETKVQKINKDFWGTWIRMDNGDEYKITDETVTVNGSVTQGIGVITKESDNVLKYGDAATAPRLFRKGGSNRDFSIKLSGFDTTSSVSRAIGTGKQGVKGKRQNKENAGDIQEIESDMDGFLHFTDAVADEKQEVTVNNPGGRPITVDFFPRYDGEFLGTIPLIESGYSFKTLYSIIQDTDGYCYGNNFATYQLEIEINNIGDADCSTPSYRVYSDDPNLTITGNVDDIFSTIETGKSKSISLDIEYGTLTEDYKDVTINIDITDNSSFNGLSARTWKDSVTIRFYKAQVNVAVSAYNYEKTNSANLHGFVISPDGRSRYFSVAHGKIQNIQVPYSSVTGDYKLVFSGATANDEMYYAFKGTKEPVTYNELINWEEYLAQLNGSKKSEIIESYETNNFEYKATKIEQSTIVTKSYVQKADIDFYDINLGDILYENAESPEFISEQSDVAIRSGKKTTLRVNAKVNDNGQLSYQWYKSSDAASTGNPITGATSAEYITDALSQNSYFYCVVTNTIPDNKDGGNKTASVKSRLITVTIDPRIHAAIPYIYSQPELAEDICLNDTVELALNADVLEDDESKGNIAYQWYVADSFTGSGIAISGETSATFNVPTDTYYKKYYYCLVTNTILDNGDGGIKTASIASDRVYVSIKCKVIFKGGEHSNFIKTDYYDYNSVITTVPEISADSGSYAVNSWKDQNGKALSLGETKVTKDTEYTAVWVEAYTVSYKTDYGTAPSSFYVYYGTALTNENLPVLHKNGDLFFCGWYKGSKWIKAGYEVTQNIELTALWKSSEELLNMILIPDTNYIFGKTEVTQELYEIIMQENPSVFVTGVAAGEVQNLRPVDKVSWFDAIVFCNTLSEMMGYEKVYSYNGSKNTSSWGYTPNKGNSLTAKLVVQDDTADGFRLPTITQWQLAAKCGKDTKYSGSNDCDLVGWYTSNSSNKTHQVAKKNPNDYGLYDMTGNVWEWCFDESSDGPSYRTVIGGDWETSALACQISYYSKNTASSQNVPYSSGNLGFRIMRYTFD